MFRGAHVGMLLVLASCTPAVGDKKTPVYRGVSPSELETMVRNEEATVLDVRDIAEFKQGHISGAKSAPLDRLQLLARSLSPEEEIVLYCD